MQNQFSLVAFFFDGEGRCVQRQEFTLDQQLPDLAVDDFSILSTCIQDSHSLAAPACRGSIRSCFGTCVVHAWETALKFERKHMN